MKVLHEPALGAMGSPFAVTLAYRGKKAHRTHVDHGAVWGVMGSPFPVTLPLRRKKAQNTKVFHVTPFPRAFGRAVLGAKR